jgi:hypothetical protein
MIRNQFLLTAALLAATCTVPVMVGCFGGSNDSNRPAVVKATGTVTHKQQPVEGATVLFVPADGGHAATGITDASGKFQLRTFEPNDGAVPGKYTVAISKYDMSTANPELEDDLASELRPDNDEPIGPTSLLPARYAEAETSGITQEVSASGANDFSFDLTE